MIEKQERSAVGFMSRHLVALAVEYDAVEKDGKIKGSSTMVFSGWLLELHDTCFWVTAGHCLKDALDENIDAGYIRITGGGFMDYLGYQAEHHHMYPFTYEPGCGMPLCRFDLGLDFALIPVDSLTRAGFAKNNNVPITRENWVHQPKLTFDFYRMLGIPEDCVFEPTPRNGNVTVQPVMMAIEKISYEEAKDIPHVKSDSWFFGRIHQEVTREVMKGMSGGPIYGFRRDAEGDLRYHVVALQSWWDKEQRVIFGCPILNFAETVYELMGWPNGEHIGTEQ